MLEYYVQAKRIDQAGSIASKEQAEIVLDTAVSGRVHAFDPVELLLAAVAARMIKGVERVMPMLKFDLRGVEASLHAKRQDSPPKIIDIDYGLAVDTDESNQRLDLLHNNVHKYGTTSNTVAAATILEASSRGKHEQAAQRKSPRFAHRMAARCGARCQ
jgi:uncharacterized OsmC-like protein